MTKSALYIRRIVLIALLGASINAFKFLLLIIPYNVEVVTLLIVVYTSTFGLGIGMGATLVFCVLEGVFWGFDPTWLVAYFIHWHVVSLCAFGVKKAGLKNPVIVAAVFAFITLCFGFQSTFTYMLTGGAVKGANLGKRYITLYASGITFYAVHIASSFLSILAGFKPLTELLGKLGARYFGNSGL